MKNYKKWSDNEIVLLRAAILNGNEDLDYLSKTLGRSQGSIACQLGRERFYHFGLEPIYVGKTIGANIKPLISV